MEKVKDNLILNVNGDVVNKSIVFSKPVEQCGKPGIRHYMDSDLNLWKSSTLICFAMHDYFTPVTE